MFKVTVTLTYEILTPKPIGIIYRSWPFMIQSKVNLDKISLKLMNGQDVANAGQMDGWTEEWMTCAIT